MEYATKPSSRSSSNVSEIVLKLAKVCRFRSIGVFSTENPNHHQYPKNNDSNNNASFTENSSDVTEEAECQDEKVHPQLAEILSETSECANVDMLKLFDAISAIKSAYVRLQEAHIPYDAEKIKAADELVVAQFQALCKIKRSYKEKQFEEANAVSVCSALLLAEIQVHERLLKKLKSQIKVKDAQILNLQQEFQDLDLKNRKFVQEFRQRERENVKVLNMSSFEEIVKAASKGIHDFAKPLIGLLKASGWDLDKAADSIEDSVLYCKRSHKKYIFEAYVARRMFYGNSNQFYNVDGILNFDDPIDSLIREPDSSFAKFCRTKYLLVVHPKMEASFFGNLDHRMFVSSGRHPRTPFYQAFVKMARWIWVLQGIAASFNPKAEMFGVKRGSKFSDVYMDCVDDPKEDMVVFDEGRAKLKVEFMVMPGFRFGNTLVRSLVYLSKMRSSDS
ncbi:protein GRAVITROPIC IN THE LIGHT 1-like [Cornus florida]|uniref:protein GRAVITROPIC IN THE LIGHT 1-like n=1 Tax=Cornus florida TaxID=4283 RepID=UPI002896DBC0|nr:protein GRAVITROPIC IN THE LIGHT 1-like [Cornus florida]